MPSRSCKLTPLRLYPEKDPHPPPHHLEKHKHEDSTLKVVNPVYPCGQPAEPREAKNEVDKNGGVVYPGFAKVTMRTETKGVVIIRIMPEMAVDGINIVVVVVVASLEVSAVEKVGDGGEEGEVPIFGDVPVEREYGVYERA